MALSQTGEFTPQSITDITDNDAMNNMTLVTAFAGGAMTLPTEISKYWWSWLDHTPYCDSNSNIAQNDVLEPYYRKDYLWNNNDSYAVVTKLDGDDYTVIAHSNRLAKQHLLANFILLPGGGM